MQKLDIETENIQPQIFHPKKNRLNLNKYH